MFSESSGKPSTSRMLSAFVCLIVMGCWAYVSIKRVELQPLSAEQVAMVLGAMGLKVFQRAREHRAVPTMPETKNLNTP